VDWHDLEVFARGGRIAQLVIALTGAAGSGDVVGSDRNYRRAGALEAGHV
jgi:hypothetical protein